MPPARRVVLVAVATLGLFAAGCAADDPLSVTAGGDTSDSPAAEPATADRDDNHSETDGHNEAAQDDEVGTSDTHETGDHSEDAPHTEDDGDARLPEGVDLVVAVRMVEFGYEIDPITIPVGSTVQFEFVNDGAVEHEAMFGDRHQQEEFAASEGDHGNHGAGDDEAGHHGELLALTLGVGESGRLIVTFDEPGEMEIGCHIPGHWDAGMVAALDIV